MATPWCALGTPTGASRPGDSVCTARKERRDRGTSSRERKLVSPSLLFLFLWLGLELPVACPLRSPLLWLLPEAPQGYTSDF